MNPNFGAETSQVLRSNCIVINLFPCTPYTEILITKIQNFYIGGNVPVIKLIHNKETVKFKNAN